MWGVVLGLGVRMDVNEEKKIVLGRVGGSGWGVRVDVTEK